MVVGLVLISTLIAAVCGGLAVLLGGGWIGAFLVYLTTGAATSMMLLLRLVMTELQRAGGEPPASLAVEGAAPSRDRPA